MMRSDDTAYSPKKVPKTDLITPKRQTRTSTGAITTPTFINLDSDSDDEDVKLISVEKPVIPPKLGGRVQVRWPAAPHLRPMAPRQQISQIRSPAPIVVNVESEGFKRTNKVSRSQTKATHFIPDIELLMECTDEPLSAAQLVKAKQAHTAHFTSREAIKLLKAQSNCTVEEVSPGIEKLVVYDKPMAVPKILGPRANTFSSNVRPSKPLMPVISSVHSMAPTLPTDNAMILRFENGYPKLVPAGRLPAFSLAQPINNCQILMSSGTTLVPANTVLSSTQYPSTLTSPVVGSSMATLTSVTPRDQSILKMSLMPNANVSSKPKMSAKEADQGYSLKRQLSLGPSVDAKRLKSTPRVNWVPLSEYYYGRLEGDPTYFEEKYSTAGTEIRFKCFHCEKMLYNNLQVMVHVQNHMDAEKQQNMDLNHLTLCSHCYVQFDTPFEKQQHVDTVHQEDSAAVVCRICEQDMGDETTLAAHMKSRHCKSEMPYCCQLCQFRSSFYADVIDHFKKRHDGSQFFLCLYCLKVVRSAMLGNSAFSGNTRYYFQHLQKHQSKRNHGSKCPSCKLIFTSRQEVDAHRQNDHESQNRPIGAKTVECPDRQVLIKVSSDVKSLNAPVTKKVQEYSQLQLRDNCSGLNCLECRLPFGDAAHLRKYIICTLCRYATNCVNAYQDHVRSYHNGVRQMTRARERPMGYALHCACGFESQFGDNVARHLVQCCKRTSYLMAYMEFLATERKPTPHIHAMMGLNELSVLNGPSETSLTKELRGSHNSHNK